MKPKDYAALLKRVNAVLTDGHFVYTSGKHGTSYVNKDAIYLHPEIIRYLGADLSELVDAKGVDGVVAPAVGAIVFGHLLAQFLELQYANVLLDRWDSHEFVFSVYAEREERFLAKRQTTRPMGVFFDGHQDDLNIGDELVAKTDRFVLKRGYDKVVKGKRVLIVEDVLTTGGTVKKVIQAVRECGGEVVGVAALVNRGHLTCDDLGVKHLVALVNIPFAAYDPDKCPYCKIGVPINTEVGKGKQFLEQKGGK